MTHTTSFEDLIVAAAKFKIPILTVEAMEIKRKLRYAGHIERIGDHEIQTIALHGEIGMGKRKVGRPLLSYRACLKRALTLFGINHLNWSIYAIDKLGWRETTNKVGCSIYMKEWLRTRNERSINRRRRRSAVRAATTTMINEMESDNDSVMNENFDTRIDVITNDNNNQYYSDIEKDLISEEKIKCDKITDMDYECDTERDEIKILIIEKKKLILIMCFQLIHGIVELFIRLLRNTTFGKKH